MENGNAPLDSDFLQTDLPMFNPVDKSALGLVTKRPGLQDGRKPGLIDLRRYMLQMGMSGIQTFMQSPVALTVEDLTAAGVDVAFIGAGTDFQYGRRGAAFGPQWVRASEIYMPPGYQVPHQHTRVDAFSELVMCDFGDAPLNPQSLYHSMQPMRECFREVAETGATTFVIGGDHAIMYPHAAALADVYGNGKVGVVHFDAHYDATDTGFGMTYTHGTGVRRLVDTGLIRGSDWVIVGYRGYAPNETDLVWMRDNGVRLYGMPQVDKFGWDFVMNGVMSDAADKVEHLYITIDMDVFDPAYAPGTGTPEPGGLTAAQVLHMVRRLCAEKHVVGIDIVELNPFVDPSNITAMLANRLMREATTGMAMHKKGMTAPDYYAPDALNPNRREGWPG